MVITDIKDVSKSKGEIWIDEDFAFVLYKSEIRKFQLEKGNEITDTIYYEIKNELLPKRAKLRAMNLLQSRDYTEKQLCDKLMQSGYGEEVVDAAIQYVKSYHYIDDARFAKSYISYRMDSKSRRKMEIELLQKGVSKDVIETVFHELEQEGQAVDEDAMIREYLRKKRYDHISADQKETQKMYGFLMRKGFSSEAIRKALFQQNWSE